jgi:mannitol 2-dehydrogenase
MTQRLALNRDNLPRIAKLAVDGQPVEWPNYPRQLRQRICHIGVGAFHRAHQAQYLHRLLQQGLADGWGICGIGLRPADLPVHRALQAQGGLYSLWEVEGASRRGKVIGSIMAHIDASEDRRPAIEVLGDEATRIVSLTITEAGYCLAPAGGLDLRHPDIAHDLLQAEAPRSAPGLIVRALARRRGAGMRGFTLMSCDNLIENGARLRSAVLGLAQALEPALARWIESEVSFPLSMVDRITPATDAGRREALCAQWGVADEAMVMCEPWQQWVLQDAFVAGRPAFEQAGVTLSDRVKDFEEIKIGLLNGGHSALSHLGLLLGYTRVHEALGDPLLRQWLSGYMAEAAQTLHSLPGMELSEYQAALIRRFLNPAIEDRLLRLAQDSSAKFLQVLAPLLVRHFDSGADTRRMGAAIALWIVYLSRLGNNAAAREQYLDASKDTLIPLAVQAVSRLDASGFLAAALPLAAAHAPRFAAAIEAHLRGIEAQGIAAYIAGLGGS